VGRVAVRRALNFDTANHMWETGLSGHICHGVYATEIRQLSVFSGVARGRHVYQVRHFFTELLFVILIFHCELQQVTYIFGLLDIFKIFFVVQVLNSKLEITLRVSVTSTTILTSNRTIHKNT